MSRWRKSCLEIGYDRVTSSGIYAVLSGKEKVLVQIGFLGQHLVSGSFFLCVDIHSFIFHLSFAHSLFIWKGSLKHYYWITGIV